MRGIFFRNLRRKLSKDVRANLRNNPEHRELRWNSFERVIVWCSTHYLLAMLLLWGTALSALSVAIFFRTIFKSFALQHLTGMKDLVSWQSGLLGGQLTVIGVVFPLVVGLISVILQKKSTREHIQSAYQVYSGYMFAGLSGLSLSAFILIGGLLSASGDAYLIKAFSVVAFFWMTLNIALSVWFFIQSLNVLDDEKRNGIMLKYFHSRAMMQYVTDSLRENWLAYPGAQLEGETDRGIRIMRFGLRSESDVNKLLKLKINRQEVISDIYIWPLKFLLRLLKPVNGDSASVTILPTGPRENGNIIILASQNIAYSAIWAYFFRRCFVIKRSARKKNYAGFPREFFGEIYDALEDRNLGAFESAVDRLLITYKRLRESFQYPDGNYLDECGGGSWNHAFTRSFHYELVRLGREAVKSVGSTGQYFSRVMRIPSSLFDRFEDRIMADVVMTFETEAEFWHCLTDWMAVTSTESSASQAQRHRELIAEFIGVHEGWLMALHIQRKNGLNQEVYQQCLREHLLIAPQLVLAAVNNDDSFAADNASDHLNLWFSLTRLDLAWQAEYQWQSVLLTPDGFRPQEALENSAYLLNGEPYDKEALLSVSCRNAVTDLRLITAAYIAANANTGKHALHSNIISNLIGNRIVYPSGSHDIMSHNIGRMSDVIDIIIRLESGDRNDQKSWYEVMSGLTQKLAGRKEQYFILGRIYTGVYEDLRSLYPAFAELALTLSSHPGTVSREILNATDAGVFTPSVSNQLVFILRRLKPDMTQPYSGQLIDAAEYPHRASSFNELIDAYIETIEAARTKKILATPVAVSIFRQTDRDLSASLISELKSDFLLSGVKVFHDKALYSTGKRLRCAMNVPREMLITGRDGLPDGLMPVSQAVGGLLCIIREMLAETDANYHHKTNDISVIIQQTDQLTSDGDDYNLIVSGAGFFDALRELEMNTALHPALKIYNPRTPAISNYSPFRVNNCNLHAFSRSGPDFCLLVRADYFSSIGIYRYPDGTIFTTFWLMHDNDPLNGELISVSDVSIDFYGDAVARFEPVAPQGMRKKGINSAEPAADRLSGLS